MGPIAPYADAAVRIEFGYISNSADAQRLADSDFRDVVAEAVSVAVVRFFAPDDGGDSGVTT